MKKNEIPSFCSATGTVDNIYDTVDFAFMATLPRLYEHNNETCIVKPKLRGVFNTTMKYIFGEDYQEQGILIYCHKNNNDPYLVLTSKKLFDEVNSTISNYSEYVYYPKGVNETTPYFDANNLCNDGIAKSECEHLKECISSGNSEDNKCKKEWMLLSMI